jgi:hypothetical protein
VKGLPVSFLTPARALREKRYGRGPLLVNPGPGGCKRNRMTKIIMTKYQLMCFSSALPRTDRIRHQLPRR